MGGGIGGVGGGVVRRKRRDARVLGEFTTALDPVEHDLADTYLSMDGLEDTPGFNELLAQATAVSEKVDGIKAETPNRQAISRLKSLSSEVAFIKDEIRKLQARR